MCRYIKYVLVYLYIYIYYTKRNDHLNCKNVVRLGNVRPTSADSGHKFRMSKKKIKMEENSGAYASRRTVYYLFIMAVR